MVVDKKITILGLDNAGKTSIITAMKKKFDLPEEILKLKPTIQVERNTVYFLDHAIHLHDFGGQKSYIQEYMQHKDRYLAGTDILFYVIDVQDELRFEESYTYLDEVLDYFQQTDQIVPIIVFMHKSDPNLMEDPFVLKHIDNIQNHFLPRLVDFKIRFFQTNIYRLHTVIRAFSQGLALLYGKQATLQKLVDDIADKMINVMSILLFEQNGIELGSYYLEGITLNMKRKIFTLYELALKRIKETNKETYEFSDRLNQYTTVSGVIQAFSLKDMAFYIVIVFNENNPEEVIQQLNFFESRISEIKEIIGSLISED